MNNLIPRLLQNRVMQALSVMPVVVITGARQTGKTTLVRELLHESRQRPFYTLDSFDVLEQAKSDPLSLLSSFPIALDEVQRAPQIMLALKQRVDEQRAPGMVIVTGSANLALLDHISESLAGRALYLELSPFCPIEWRQTSPGLEELVQKLFESENIVGEWPRQVGVWKYWLLQGGYPPAAALRDDAARGLWFTGYVQTYLERGLRNVSAIASLADFQRTMRLAARRTARLCNESEIARDAAIKQPTCHRYFNLLETTCLISRLPVYAANHTKGLVKSKKLFWNDCGLAAWLAGIGSVDALERRDDRGFWLEQALFQSLHVWQSLDPGTRRLYYWRDRQGAEVDFILEQGERLVALEVKHSRAVGKSDWSGLTAFAKSLGSRRSNLARAAVLYDGEQPRPLPEGMAALPLAPFF